MAISAMQSADLAAIERHFHALIRERCAALVDEHGVALPSIAGLAVGADKPAWFPVPGMYGGFAYRLAIEEGKVALVVESWSRVIEGSEQRHVVTENGYRLAESGLA